MFVAITAEVRSGVLVGLGGAFLSRLPAGNWAVVDDCLWENEDGLDFVSAWKMLIEWTKMLSRGQKPVLLAWGKQTYALLKRQCHGSNLSFPWAEAEDVWDVRSSFFVLKEGAIDENHLRLENCCDEFGIGEGVYIQLRDARDRANALSAAAKFLQTKYNQEAAK